MSFIVDYNCFTPLGADLQTTLDRLEEGVSGIQLFENSELLPAPYYAARLPEPVVVHQGFTRLENMLIRALEPVVERNPVQGKSLLLVSTTKGNIRAISGARPEEDAFLPAMAGKIARYFGFGETPWVLSNACVSGILAVAVAKRLIDAGLFDAVYVVAGDEVTEFVLSGFAGFQALSSGPCRPYDKNRDGVTLGEAAAAVLVSGQPGLFRIAGDGAVNDANHISGPSRTGEGLYRSICGALEEAGLSGTELDFISAHGTATEYNDEMEAIALDRLGLNEVPVNSLKGYFGHTLGASGLLEAVISFESARKGIVYPSLGFETPGVSRAIHVVEQAEEKPVRYFMKTASGFGGCNTAVIFEKLH